jgi:hypothetical protein
LHPRLAVVVEPSEVDGGHRAQTDTSQEGQFARSRAIPGSATPSSGTPGQPGKGTTLQLADKEQGVPEGKGFADAVFSIWLGAKPPSEDLRKGMLG